MRLVLLTPANGGRILTSPLVGEVFDMQADILTMRRLHEQHEKRRQQRSLRDYAASVHTNHLTPSKQQTRAALPMIPPAPAQPVQPQMGSVLDDLIKLTAETGWGVFKAK